MSKNKRLIIIFSVICGLTLLVVLSSVVFAVQEVSVFCVNVKSDDPLRQELDEKVLFGKGLDGTKYDRHGIRYGSSIFMLNERKTIETINQRLAADGIADVEVINIERHFPNRVELHYINIDPFFCVARDGKTYYYGKDDARLMKVADGGRSPQAPLKYAVEVRTGGKIMGAEPGVSVFSTDKPFEKQSAAALLAALETLCQPAELNDYFDFIDISREGKIFAKTRLGLVLEFSSFDRLQEQFLFAVATYNEFRQSGKTEDAVRAGTGTLIVSIAVSGLRADYTVANRYG